MIYVLDDGDFHVNIVKNAFPDKEVKHFRDSKSLLVGLRNAGNVQLIVIDLKIDHGDIPDENFFSPNPSTEGIFVAEKIRKHYKDIPIVLSTRFATSDIFIRAKYLQIVPIEIPDDKKVAIRKLRENFPELTDSYDKAYIFKVYSEAGFVTASPVMFKVLKKLEKWKDHDEPLLITGETGTGKDTLAKAVHLRSKRASEPYINFVISAYPRDNLYAKMFGIIDKAFTGVKAHPGVIEDVGKGTLVLNEIGDLDTNSQINLLQVMEEKVFFKMQSNKPLKFKGRFILLTNKNLEELVRKGKFRKDLFRRIAGFHVHIPPLRDRREDIPAIVEYLAPRLKFTVTAKKFLFEEYEYPENVGTLVKILQNLEATLNSNEMVTLDEIIEIVSSIHRREDMPMLLSDLMDDIPRAVLDYMLKTGITIKDFEDRLIKAAYEKFGHIWRKDTWGKLGIPRTTFYRKRD